MILKYLLKVIILNILYVPYMVYSWVDVYIFENIFKHFEFYLCKKVLNVISNYFLNNKLVLWFL